MALIRMQEKVPYVYVDRSRDFQVLCRGYDTVLNQVKFDIDSMPFVLSSTQCRDSVLPLLQTKLGFETNKLIDGDSLRLILAGFPDIVKYKGSILGIQRAVNTWLKIIHLETLVYIDVFNLLGGPYDLIQNKDRTVGGYIGQTLIPPYTIAIGIGGNPRDYSILKEILRYVKPTGYNLYFYFFREFSTEATPVLHGLSDKAVLVYVSDDVNSSLRGVGENGNLDDAPHDTSSIREAEVQTRGKVIGSVATIEAMGIRSSDNKPQAEDILNVETTEN